MKVTVELTPEQEQFLRLFATNQAEGSRDNVETKKPLHIVQTRTTRTCAEGQEELLEYFWENEFMGYSPEELVAQYYENAYPLEIIPFSAVAGGGSIIGIDGQNHAISYSLKSYFNAYGIDPSKIENRGMQYEYNDVAYFFILAEAKRYIEDQRHNLSSPRTYTVDCGYSNYGEYEHFYDLLMGMGEQLLGDVLVSE